MESHCGGPNPAALIHANVRGVLMRSSQNDAGEVMREDQRI